MLGCRDWSRIDVRLDAAGRANIVEVNPLPGILPDPADNSCLPKAARAAGLDYDALIGACLAAAAGATGRRARERTHEDRDPLRRRERVRASRPTRTIIGNRGRGRADSLTRRGERVVRIPVHPDATWIDKLRRARVDLVFNLCESIDGVAALEPPVISVLELLGAALHAAARAGRPSLCLRKHVVNAALERAGLPVPQFAVVRRGGAIPSVGFPAICKPAAEDASIGVEQRSVVRTTRALAERVSAMLERWDEVLVQRYVEGREVNVGILGDAVLPIAEIDFGRMPKGMWRIVTYRSKWEDGSRRGPRLRAALPGAAAGERRVAAAEDRRRGVADRRRHRLRPRRPAHRRAWSAVDSRGERQPRHLARRRDSRAWRASPASTTARSCARSASSDSQRSRDGATTAERWALAQRLSGVAPESARAGPLPRGRGVA